MSLEEYLKNRKEPIFRSELLTLNVFELLSLLDDLVEYYGNKSPSDREAVYWKYRCELAENVAELFEGLVDDSLEYEDLHVWKKVKAEHESADLNKLIVAVRFQLGKFLKNEERLEFMNKIMFGYCRNCGCNEGKLMRNCQCWNDK